MVALFLLLSVGMLLLEVLVVLVDCWLGWVNLWCHWLRAHEGNWQSCSAVLCVEVPCPFCPEKKKLFWPCVPRC